MSGSFAGQEEETTGPYHWGPNPCGCSGKGMHPTHPWRFPFRESPGIHSIPFPISRRHLCSFRLAPLLPPACAAALASGCRAEAGGLRAERALRVDPGPGRHLHPRRHRELRVRGGPGERRTLERLRGRIGSDATKNPLGVRPAFRVVVVVGSFFPIPASSFAFTFHSGKP